MKMCDQCPERRSAEERRQDDRRQHERRQYFRRAKGSEKPFFEVVPGRRKKSDRRSGVDRREGQRRQQLRRESDAKALEKKLVLRNGLYYLEEKVRRGPRDPYCTCCFDNSRKLIPPERNIDQSRKLATHVCPYCGAIY
jgi:hypothetical protein